MSKTTGTPTKEQVMKNEEETNVVQNTLPESGLARLSQIVGDKKRGV